MNSVSRTLSLAVLCFLLYIPVVAQVDLQKGLIAYYPFKGNANDESGFGNHGTVMNGAKLTTDKFGNPNSAYQFDGIDDYIVVNDNGRLSSPAISVVALMNTESTQWQTIVGKIQYNTGYAATYNLGINYDAIQQGYFFGTTPEYGTSCTQQYPYDPTNPFVKTYNNFSVNQWHCVVGTFENSQLKIYVDGVLVDSYTTNYSKLLSCSNTQLMIGGWWSGYQGGFKGKIDEVRVYNRALNEQEVSTFCTMQPCSDWLKLPSTGSFVELGDLDIQGKAITVEAQINQTALKPGGRLFQGDIVTKHFDPRDVNYLLRPNHAEITTTSGYYITPEICDVNLSQTYHVAMVYDGAALKFYRNGILMSQVAATGDMINNDWPARIGWYSDMFYDGNFEGYVNEVRIWNVVRTEAELQAFMNSSLPSPTTQPGLQAYYVFNNLENKQGNATWDGTLAGAAAINQTNPLCMNVVPEPCCVDPEAGLSGSTVCAGLASSLTFSAQKGVSPFTITYSNGTQTFTESGLSNGSVFTSGDIPTAATTYTITSITDANGCIFTPTGVSVTINVDQPVVAIAGTDEVCPGTSVPLTASGAATYAWSPATGLSDAASPSPTAVVNNTIIYTVTGTTAFGCKATATKQIAVTPKPSFTIIPDTKICEGSSIVLQTSGGTQHAWSPVSSLDNGNITSPTATPLNDTRYYVNYRDSYNCLYNDSVDISITRKPVFVSPGDTSVCLNEAVRLKQPNINPTYTYKWSPASILDDINAASPIARATLTTQYTLTIRETTCGFEANFAGMIRVHPLPDLTITKSNDIDCIKASAELTVAGASAYTWSPAELLNATTGKTVRTTASASATYFVKGISSAGCVNEDSITVERTNTGEQLLVMANAFSPNGDQVNDCFGASRWHDLPGFQLSVYNRFGNLVFHSTNSSKCWDGRFKGQPQAAGAYVYIVKAISPCGEVFKKGTVLLIR